MTSTFSKCFRSLQSVYCRSAKLLIPKNYCVQRNSEIDGLKFSAYNDCCYLHIPSGLHLNNVWSIETTGLWGLVNNAGILYILPIEWAPLDIFKRIADVNLWGMIEVSKTFLPLVKKARGRVVNFSSAAGKRGIDLIMIAYLFY